MNQLHILRNKFLGAVLAITTGRKPFLEEDTWSVVKSALSSSGRSPLTFDRPLVRRRQEPMTLA